MFRTPIRLLLVLFKSHRTCTFSVCGLLCGVNHGSDYTAMGEKKIAEIEKYLDPDIQFRTPLAKIAGKEGYIGAGKNFPAFFKALTIRATFGEGNQAMVVHDVDFPAPIGNFPGAALMTFQAGLVTKIELFYDARPFEEKKNEIFL